MKTKPHPKSDKRKASSKGGKGKVGRGDAALAGDSSVPSEDGVSRKGKRNPDRARDGDWSPPSDLSRRSASFGSEVVAAATWAAHSVGPTAPTLAVNTDVAAAASPQTGRDGPVTSPSPDFEVLARNVGLLLEQGGKLAGAWLTSRKQRPVPDAEDYATLLNPIVQVASYWIADPARLIQAQTALSSQLVDLWADSVKRFSGAPPDDDKRADRARDKRFADPEWRENPFFDFVRRAYLVGTDWARDMVEDAESVDEPIRHKARFLMRQVASALSPSNFVLTNPELLRDTLAENGGNLVRGLKSLADDLAAGDGDLRIRQTDESRFELGVNVAVTPGKVVFRNELIELLQYAPRSEAVLRRPLLIVPPWINKFYILDLNPEKSFIGWAVAQGLTVFVVSWVNPDARHADKGWDAYLDEGVYAALDAVTAATGEVDVAALGYCVGGTLLAAAMAHMSAKGDDRVSSATLLTTQVDFTRAGDLKVFADAPQIEAVEAEMARTGVLKGAKMTQAFNMLRPDDLIWSYVVNNYLKGKEPVPFDLLAWNADATRMTAANHSFYLRQCYLENALATGRMVLGGERLDLGRVTTPVYNLATREDHIAPAPSVYDGSRRFGGPVRTVVAGSGHIAGVVNPPAKTKYGYWSSLATGGTFEDWLATATHTPGSWWPDWFAWLRGQAPAAVPARHPGDGALATLGDAPGTYVRVKG